MKKIICVILVLFISISISGQTKEINVSSSKINWIGKKITGQHSGIINFKEGRLVFIDNVVAGGYFVADMTTLANTDQSGENRTKLENHLKGDDFFCTDKFKTSVLEFKTIAKRAKNIYNIKADLTIKGITHPVTFTMETNDKTAKARVTIDRTKYNIQYGSGSFFDDLGDRTIYNDFELYVTLHY